MRNRREDGGTLLLDASGSMDIESEQLQELLSSSGGLQVAVYGSLPENLQSGRLVIAARRGRYADPDLVRRLVGSGNVVDGPALCWLRRQRAPRIWVCDGHVTGVGDSAGTNLSAEAAHLVRMGRISQMKGLKDASTQKKKQHPLS